jgi:hypothetical protein
MTCRIRLVLAIHDHQPVGNFEGVFENAYRDSYAPFLELVEQYPGIAISLHHSGSLLEWLVAAHPEYIDRVRSLVERGQVELVGGPFYEPILAGIPRRDRVGQIVAYSRYLEQLFGTPVRGMWVPERVWEQSFASDIAQSGIEYTILDDFHFRQAGLDEDQLHGFYLTEDEGRLLKVFPGSEKLRYTIPFADPYETIHYLREIAEKSPNTVVTFGDDGEKFGTWPETKKHVYEDGWLRHFFDALTENAEWLKVCTLAEAVDNVAPTGRVYLPDCSYREMTEWALPSERQTVLYDLSHEREHDETWQRAKPFVRGGFWRNFRVKYREANEMYCRMLEVSERIENLATNEQAQAGPDLLAEAKTSLYKAQCNCSYWHGAFGGLYLPHLRNAVYEHLIAADNLIERLSGRADRWVEITSDDFDLDARQEIRIAGDRLIGYLSPARGGHLYELDIRATRHNLLATLDRRPEPYHGTVREKAGQVNADGNVSNAESIHDAVRFKQPGLDKKLIYDGWPRKSLVDHFLQPGLDLEEFRLGHGVVGDFTTGVYETVLRRSAETGEVRMSRQGHVGPYIVQVVKTVALDTRQGGRLETHYELSGLPPGLPMHFGVEFNFAGMAACQPDRYFYDASGSQLGSLETIQNLSGVERFGLIDEWLGLDAALEFSEPADIWAFPIETVSQSEGGFELVHQSTAVVPRWTIQADEDGCFEVTIALEIDTSAAQARALRETAIAR